MFCYLGIWYFLLNNYSNLFRDKKIFMLKQRWENYATGLPIINNQSAYAMIWIWTTRSLQVEVDSQWNSGAVFLDNDVKYIFPLTKLWQHLIMNILQLPFFVTHIFFNTGNFPRSWIKRFSEQVFKNGLETKSPLVTIILI